MKNSYLIALVLPLIMQSACGGDESLTVVSPKQISLHKGEQSQIEVISESPVRYGSMDDFHASVDGNGLITANYVGDTRIGVKNGSGQDYVDVKVIPVSTMLIEPYHSDFTIRKDIIIKMYGDGYAINGNTITYQLSKMGASASFTFSFAGEKDVLQASEVALAQGTEIAEVEYFLGERYKPVDGEERLYQDTMDGGAGTVYVRLKETGDGVITITYSTSR